MARERQQSGDFGSSLKQAREVKGVSLRRIADVTRISVAALEALERNDISRLPGGIFSRGFVRSYANEVGLDPDATVDLFVRQFPDDSVTVGHPTTVRHDYEDLETKRGATTRVVAVAVIGLAAAALAVYFGLTGWPGRTMRDTSETPVAIAAASPRPTRLVVDIIARMPCTLSFAADGQASVDVSLPAGSQRTIAALGVLALTVSDASAVDVQINGAPAKPIGVAGSPATVNITLDNVRALLVEP